MTSVNGATAPRGTRLLIFFLVALYSAWCLRVTIVWPLEDRIATPWIRQVLADIIKIALWVVPAVVYLKWVDRVRPLAYMKLASRPRRMTEALAIIMVYLGATALIAVKYQHTILAFQRGLSASAWAYSLSFTPISAIAEEMLFRGFVLLKLREVYLFQPANLIMSALFVLIHWPGWLYMGRTGMQLVVLSAGIFLIAWVLGFLVERTNSLWPSIVLHAANNLMF